MRTRALSIVGVCAALLLIATACTPGTPDIGFGSNGVVVFAQYAHAAQFVQLVAQADGGVVATDGQMPLTRITPTGTVDASWGSALPSDCRSVGRPVASGTSIVVPCSHLLPPSGPEVWQLWRVTAAGALDTTFGNGGVVDLPTTLNALDVAALPGGGYLVLGHAVAVPSPTSVPPLFAVVYSATGSEASSTEIDVSVSPAPDGWGYTLDASTYPTPAGAVAFDVLSMRSIGASSSIVTNQIAEQHFDAGGAPTAAPVFSPRDEVTTAVTGFVPLSGGREATTGTTTTYDPQYEQEIVTTSWLRVTLADGSADPGFASGHDVALMAPDGTRADPTGLALTADGSALLVVGNSTSGHSVLSRFDATTGAPTAGFGTNGTATLQLSGVASVVPRSGAAQIYAGGALSSSAQAAVAREIDVASS